MQLPREFHQVVPCASSEQVDSFAARYGSRKDACIVRVGKRVVLIDHLRFLKASRLIKAEHPGIVPLIAHGFLPEGEAFAAVARATDSPLANGPMAFPALVQAARQLSSGLLSAHQVGLVHGSLSARSIATTHRGYAIDFSEVLFEQPAGATAEKDAAALAQVLLECAGSAQEREALERAWREVLSGQGDARVLCDATLMLEQLSVAQTRISETSPSAEGPRKRETEPGRLGGYALGHVLGEGGMGSVFIGKVASTGREVAVKVLKPELCTDGEVVRRFMQEAIALNTIHHPHIVRVEDFGEEERANGQPSFYYVMERLHGRTLQSLLEERRLDLSEVRSIAEQLASALAAAHRLGIVHRDIKPDNIFLAHADGIYIKVLDFGVAKFARPLGSVTLAHTKAGTVLGTPQYMAPEQVKGLGIGPPVDVHAWGLVVYEMLSGRPAYSGESYAEMMVAIATREPRALPSTTRQGEEIPEAWARLVTRALEKEPRQRFSSGQELLEEFQALFPSTRTPSSSPTVNLASVTRLSSALELEAAAGPVRRPWQRWVVAAAATVLLVGGALVLSTLRASEPGRPVEPARRVEEATARPIPTPVVEAPRVEPVLPEASAAPVEPRPESRRRATERPSEVRLDDTPEESGGRATARAENGSRVRDERRSPVRKAVRVDNKPPVTAAPPRAKRSADARPEPKVESRRLGKNDSVDPFALEGAQ